MQMSAFVSCHAEAGLSNGLILYVILPTLFYMGPIMMHNMSMYSFHSFPNSWQRLFLENSRKTVAITFSHRYGLHFCCVKNQLAFTDVSMFLPDWRNNEESFLDSVKQMHLGTQDEISFYVYREQSWHPFRS